MSGSGPRGFRKLRIAEVQPHPGGGAKSLFLEIGDAEQAGFRWKAGQHLTLGFVLGGREVRRCYSIFTSPHTGEPPGILVKQIANGPVSTHINEFLEAGDEIDVMPPFGGFLLEPDPSARRTYYMIGAGSGITPLHSMLQSVLVAEPHSTVHLIYGNRTPDTVLLRDRLDDLKRRHPNTLTVSHVLSRNPMFSGCKPWRTGRVDSGAVEAAIRDFPPYAQDTRYFVCGPGAMNRTVREALVGLDVPGERIRSESFGGGEGDDDTVSGCAATATIVMNGRTESVPIAAGQTVLQAARACGLQPPYSCQAGVCGACRADLRKGSVHMRSRAALDDGEIDMGAVLTCQSVATSTELELSFD